VNSFFTIVCVCVCVCMCVYVCVYQVRLGHSEVFLHDVLQASLEKQVCLCDSDGSLFLSLSLSLSLSV